MDIEKLKATVKAFISQAQAGASIENPKFDFKRKWPDLQDSQGISTFLRLVTSLANSVGPEGIVVYGFDEKSNEFHDAKFTDCGLKDTSQLNGLIVKRVDKAFILNCVDIDIEGHSLSVIQIPVSFDKPHVIKSYEKKSNSGPVKEDHRIFVRKGSASELATKYDLDLMYYDQKNFILDYDLRITSGSIGIFEKDNKYRFQMRYIIENTGRRIVGISKLEFQFEVEFFLPEIFNLSVVFGKPDDKQYEETIKISPIIIRPNDIVSGFFKLAPNFPIEKRITPKEIENLNNQNAHYYRNGLALMKLTSGEEIKKIVRVM